MNTNKNEPQLHIYVMQDEQIEVPLVDTELWLTQKSMAKLFGTTVQNVGQHINNVKAEDQLDDSVIKKIFITAADGKKYSVNHYNLNVIIPVGYRVNSAEASRFRRWANDILRDYLTQGIVVNEARLEKLDDTTLERVSSHSVNAIVNAYRKKGYSDEKIRARLNGIVSRNDLTDALQANVEKPKYGQFTNHTYLGLFKRDADQLTKANGGEKPRDGMTAQGLDLLSATESTVASVLRGRQYVRFYEALAILDNVCEQVAPAVKGLQKILGIDLGTSQPLLKSQGGQNVQH